VSPSARRRPAPRATSRFQTSPKAITRSPQIERIRAAGACRPRAGGRTGHRVHHVASRLPGGDHRHGRKGGRARCSRDSHRDQCRLASRSRPPRQPHHRRGAGAGPFGDVFAEHRLGPAHDPRDRFKPPDRRIGSGGVSRRGVPRPAGDGVRTVPRSGAHRSASRAAPTTSRHPPALLPETSENFARTRG
jgi:hypothetical protein